MSFTDLRIVRLSSDDHVVLRELSALFGNAFGQKDVYCDRPPSDDYLKSLLSDPSFVAICATIKNQVVGGAVAYELKKFEQQRSELYIYDLAVSSEFRRKGIATEVIRAVSNIASEMGAWVVFVQADYEDVPAVKLYSKLGTKEEVLHFDLPVD